MLENLSMMILLNGLEMYKVGIVGMGFVGKAVFHGFSLFCETKGYDIDPKKSTHTLDDVLNSDFVFVCLPTPESSNGSADLTYIHDFFNSLEKNIASSRSSFLAHILIIEIFFCLFVG